MKPTSPLSPAPHSSSFTNASDTSDPLTCLDALLEIYLDCLDTYQKLREELSKNLSAGFLSLANANRTSNLGSGRRYGAEGYDERMKARRRAKLRPPGQEYSSQATGKGARDGVETGAHSILYAVEQRKLPELESGDLRCTPVPLDTLAQVSANSSASPPSIQGPKTPDSLTASSISSEADAAPDLASPPVEKPTTPTKQNPRTYPDPLNWYGLLVPPSLRAAQASFISAVDNQIPLLLNTQAQMTKLEVQIRALRREAGLSHQNVRETDDSMAGTPSTDEAKGGEEEEEGVQPSDSNDVASDQMANGKDEDKRSQSKTKTKTSGSGRERKSLSSRPKEPPRSRVLKLE
jgi:coiled-coil domain-containing protein 115